MPEPIEPQPTMDEPGLPDTRALGDATLSASTLPLHGSVLDALTVSRVRLREERTDAEKCARLSLVDSAPAAASMRYQIEGEIARGGMGAVLVGRDTSLGRPIAIKVMLETHAGKTELVQRFVEEAQIAGQLQHPGITPVYELGQFTEGRPYFTMKLVKGKTLAALLADQPAATAGRAPLIGIFGQVCQTLAYAHARGVVHRDLKPSNIMVGNFGEVQVMDWGLAKVLRDDRATDDPRHPMEQVRTSEAPRSPAAVGEDAHTRAGTVLGTPAYMAPEQARGEVDLVDERADVFGLGGILCEILTGKPPFTGRVAEAIRKTQMAQLNEALDRLASCDAERELVDLARRCLAPQPKDRPRNAGVVADAVTAYQNGVAERLRQAELAHVAEVARTVEAQATAAAERHARRLTVGLAAAVLALVSVGAAGGLWLQRTRSEQIAEALHQRQAAEAALDRATERRLQARWAEARAVLEQTRDRLGDAGPEDLRQRVAQALADLALVDRLEAIRLKRSTTVGGTFDNPGAERAYAAVFREVGLGAPDEEPTIMAHRVRQSAVAEQLIAALDDWAAVSDPKHQAWILAVARQADPDPWRDRFRQPVVWQNRTRLEKLARELLADPRQLARQQSALLGALGTRLLHVKADAVPVLAAAQAQHPSDFWLNFELAQVLEYAKRWTSALAFYRAAAAVRPSAAAARNNLAVALIELHEVDASLQECQAAIALEPRLAAAHANLARALLEKRQVDAAIEECHKAIALAPTLWAAHDHLGRALRAKHQLDAAIREYRIAVTHDPNNAIPHINLGVALADQQQFARAIDEYHKAIALDPANAVPRFNLGNALAAQRQFQQAAAEYRKAIALDPQHLDARNNLATVLSDLGRPAEAVAEYRALIALDPSNAGAHTNLGALLAASGAIAAALAEYRQAIVADPTMALPHYNLANALKSQGRLDEAVEEYHRAIKLNPSYPQAHGALGQALMRAGRFSEACEATRRCMALLNPTAPMYRAAQRQLKECQRRRALNAKLSGVLAGKEKPTSNAERLALAQLCQQPFNKQFAASYHLFAEAFAIDRTCVDDMVAQYRYNAACAAALAGCGQGSDAATLDASQRARARQQALTWLRADLAYWTKQAAKAQARQTLQQWQTDPDLAGLRAANALAKLPADERTTWQALWTDVARVLERVKK